MAGVRVFVPQGVEIDAWSWRNLALADLEPLGRAIPVRPHQLRSASVAMLRLPDRNVFLMEPAAKLQRGPAVLLSAGRDLFLAPASRLAERRRR